MSVEALADLERSGITAECADYAGMFPVANARKLFPKALRKPAIIIPYYELNGEPMLYGDADEFGRLRYLGMIEVDPYTGKKGQRYYQPKSSGCRAYFPKVIGFQWEDIAADPEEPLVITEGEKKALCACINGFATIGLGGVYNFMRDDMFLPELEQVVWLGRSVFITFDSDARTNVEIQRAEARLVQELRKRGAKLYVIRIPAEGDTKVGLDDYIVKHGVARFASLVDATRPLEDMDAAVVAMNAHVSWISKEGMVFSFKTKSFISKDNFVNGDQYGAITAMMTKSTGKKPGQEETYVAPVWLKHPHALRYADRIFRPNEPRLVETPSGELALNIWEGFETLRGDVTPFFKLTDFLFRNLPEEHRELALKLVVYKAQNPQEKIPLAILLLAPQEGGGKSLWCAIVAEAFGQYGVRLGSRTALVDEFQGWLEGSLFAVIDEVEVDDMRHGYERMKGMISDLRRHMNEKYRLARQINSYTFYALTTNKTEVAAFSKHDRRMFVVDCPGGSALGDDAAQKEFFDPIYEWKNHAHGAKKLMQWMLTVDLGGWKPPQRAPETAEKMLAAEENMGDIARIAQDMLEGKEHAIEFYIRTALGEAEMLVNSQNPRTAQDARVTLDVLPELQLRPFYTADEIGLLFPALTAQLTMNRRTQSKPAGVISRTLRENGIPYLRCIDNPRGFWHKGKLRQYLVVADQEHWTGPITQTYFDTLMLSYPRFKQTPKKPRLIA